MSDAPDDSEREILTWPDFGEAARELAATILRTGWMPDIVVAVARGGLLPGGAIAYALGAKNCGALNVELYTGIGTTLSAPVISPPMLDRDALRGMRVLLVDDVSDSGRTLAMSVELIRDAGAEVRSVTLYTKPGTLLEPDFYWRRTPKWINFPWSVDTPVRL